MKRKQGSGELWNNRTMEKILERTKHDIRYSKENNLMTT